MSEEKTLKVWEVKLYGEQQPRTIEADTCTVGPLWNAQSQTNRAEFWRDNELVAIVPTYEMIRCLGEATRPEPPRTRFDWRKLFRADESDLIDYCRHRGSTKIGLVVRKLSMILDRHERLLNGEFEAIQPEGPPASPFEPPRYWRFRLGHEETDTLGSAMGYHFCPTRYEKLIHALVSLLDEYERS